MQDKLNDNLKTFSLLVIAASLFTMSIIQILNLINSNQQQNINTVAYPNGTESNLYPDGAPHPPVPVPNDAPKTSITYKEYTFDFGTINKVMW